MYVLEGSDRTILPMKLTNKGAKASAEPAEGRVRTEENDVEPNTQPTQSGTRVSQGLDGVRQAARVIRGQTGLTLCKLDPFRGRTEFPLMTVACTPTQSNLWMLSKPLPTKVKTAWLALR